MHNSQYVLHADTPKIVLSSVFKKYDKDVSGELDIGEFSRALSDLGVVDETEQKAIFHLADADNGGTVGIDEFIQLIKSNEFDQVLSSHEELEFIYQTYKTFQPYDANGDGEISWEEFYFYLTKQGYSHQHISQHWHFLDEDKNASITFLEFWKGYKTMAQHQLQQQQLLEKQQNNDDIDEKEQKENEIKAKKAKLSKVISADDDLEFNNKDDGNNILNAVKGKLKKSSHKMNKSEFKTVVGKVVGDDDDDDNDKDDKVDGCKANGLDIKTSSFGAESEDDQ